MISTTLNPGGKILISKIRKVYEFKIIITWYFFYPIRIEILECSCFTKNTNLPENKVYEILLLKILNQVSNVRCH